MTFDLNINKRKFIKINDPNLKYARVGTNKSPKRLRTEARKKKKKVSIHPTNKMTQETDSKGKRVRTSEATSMETDPILSRPLNQNVDPTHPPTTDRPSTPCPIPSTALGQTNLTLPPGLPNPSPNPSNPPPPDLTHPSVPASTDVPKNPAEPKNDETAMQEDPPNPTACEPNVTEETTNAEAADQVDGDNKDDDDDEEEEGQVHNEYVDDHATTQEPDPEACPSEKRTNTNINEPVKLIAWVPLNANSEDLVRMIDQKNPKLDPVKPVDLQKGSKSFGKETFPDLQAYIYLHQKDVAGFLQRTKELKWYHKGGETDEIHFNTVKFTKIRYYVRFNSLHRQDDRSGLNTQTIRNWFDRLKTIVSVKYWTVSKKFSIILLEFQTEKQVQSALRRLQSMFSVGGDDIKKALGYKITSKERIAIKATSNYSIFRLLRKRIHTMRHKKRIHRAQGRETNKHREERDKNIGDPEKWEDVSEEIIHTITTAEDMSLDNHIKKHNNRGVPDISKQVQAYLDAMPTYSREQKGKQRLYPDLFRENGHHEDPIININDILNQPPPNMPSKSVKNPEALEPIKTTPTKNKKKTPTT
jgi:hypothetical protein